jgi:cell wall-associated NlpC family hydrolase
VDGRIPFTIKGSWLSRILAMLAVFSLFVVCVPTAHATSMGLSGLGSPGHIAPGGGPARTSSLQLTEARAAAVAAYRGALRAARTAGIRLHVGPGVIVRTTSVSRLRQARTAWLGREHRYQRITRRRHLVVRSALGQRGTRYAWGGASPSGFDCSGLVMWAYRRAGISLPHSTYALIELGRAVSRRSIQPGDLVFSEGGGHVGIYIGHGMVVHAPHSGTVVSVARLGTWSVIAIRRII